MADRLSRKLAVILHADVVGSTLLVQRHESMAHELIQDSFRRFSETIEAYGGTAREIRGDALVAEFARASDAVTAAIAFQISNADSNTRLEGNIQPQLRIGISLGEVIVADSTVTGEGVVLAQRLEQLAAPGGVVVEGSVAETVPKRLPFDFKSLGEQALKGFDQPVRAFTATLSSAAGLPSPELGPGDLRHGKAAGPLLELPDKPSIAVLPFTNMSNDPEQEYLSDGITEDIITALSKVSSLMVIARTSTFAYKDKVVDVKQVGREQGVRYVLQGSIRKAANRVRVAAQLIDATTGLHIWAERYDRELDDIFAVQDELMREIVVALDVELREGEQMRMWSSGTKNVEAWECVRLSAAIVLGDHDGNLLRARKLLDRALELDPNYAIAWVMLGWFHQNFADIGGKSGDVRAGRAALTSMRQCAQKALELDPSCADAYSVMAKYHMERNEFEDAIENAERSCELAPANAGNFVEAAGVMVKAGKPQRGLELVKKAMRLCPLHRAGFLRALARAYRFTGNPAAAVDTLRESLNRQPDNLSGHVNLTSVLGELGRIDEAEAEASQILRLAPDFSVKGYMQGLSYRNSEDSLRVEEGLRRAGLPD